MLAIRLRRTGARKDAHYRIVVIERSMSRDGRFLEILGHYHPRRQPMEVTFKFDRTDEWIGKGAQMSSTVRALYKMATGSTTPAEERAPAPVETPAVADDAEIETAAAAEASEEGAAAAESEADNDATTDADAAPGDDADGEAK